MRYSMRCMNADFAVFTSIPLVVASGEGNFLRLYVNTSFMSMSLELPIANSLETNLISFFNSTICPLLVFTLFFLGGKCFEICRWNSGENITFISKQGFIDEFLAFAFSNLLCYVFTRLFSSRCSTGNIDHAIILYFKRVGRACNNFNDIIHLLFMIMTLTFV